MVLVAGRRYILPSPTESKNKQNPWGTMEKKEILSLDDLKHNQSEILKYLESI